MKLLISLAATTALLLASACAGLQARENVLIPAMKTAFVGIEKNIGEGVVAAKLTHGEAQVVEAEVAKMRIALDSGDPYTVKAADWQRLMPLATLGVTSRNLVPSVERILLMRIEKFDRAYIELVRVLR